MTNTPSSSSGSPAPRKPSEITTQRKNIFFVPVNSTLYGFAPIAELMTSIAPERTGVRARPLDSAWQLPVGSSDVSADRKAVAFGNGEFTFGGRRPFASGMREVASFHQI